MLKAINKLATKAKSQTAAWNRWSRKWPKNRVSRKRIRNEAGQTIGYEPGVPIPEPATPEPFCKIGSTWAGVRAYANHLAVQVAQDYAKARTPKAEAKDVVRLVLSEDMIRGLFAKYCQ